MDPKNLKTMISFGSGPGDVTNGSAIDPARYPRLVLCAENPIADINKYNVAEVQYGEDYVKPDIRPFPPLRLTYARKRLKYDWAFRSLEMCATFEFGKVIRINWHGVKADLKAYMSVGDSEATEPVGTEPRITRSVRGLSERFVCSLEPNKSLVIRMKTISVHEIYVGPGSTFCNSYPQHVRPYLPAYDIGHCVDLLYLQWLRESGKKTCYRKYKMILDELNDSKGGWKSAEAYGCRLKHSSRSRSALYLDCGCSPDSWTEGPGEEKARNQALVDEHCKRSHMNIIWSESGRRKSAKSSVGRRTLQEKSHEHHLERIRENEKSDGRQEQSLLQVRLAAIHQDDAGARDELGRRFIANRRVSRAFDRRLNDFLPRIVRIRPHLYRRENQAKK